MHHYSGLSADAYTSEEWFRKEQKHLFSRVWQFACFVEDLPEAGDFVTTQVGLHNIIVIKQKDERLKAFHNLCRHRGTPLLGASGQLQGSIICPYHHWTYSLEGDLTNIPLQRSEFPELDKHHLCLHKAKVEIWLGMVWVHASPDAEPLSEWLGDIKQAVGPHPVEEMPEVEEEYNEYTIKANWKIVAENYLDGYHLSFLHHSTLNMYDHRRQQTEFLPPHFAFYEPLSQEYANNVQNMSQLPVLDCFTDEQPMGAYVPLIFPNFGIDAIENSWGTFHIQPISATETRIINRTRVKNVSDWEFGKQELKALAYIKNTKPVPLYESQDEALSSGDFTTEDIYICEALQQSIQSPLFSVSKLAANQEKLVVAFHQQVKDFMQNDN